MGVLRWLLGVVVTAAVGTLLFHTAVGLYLGSSHGKAVVADQLQSLIGMPVEVAEVEFGTHTSAVKFRVLDPTSTKRSELLAVESASADVSFAEVLAGRVAPREVSLSGVRLSLQVRNDGTVFTGRLPHLPDSWIWLVPAVAVENAGLTVRQDDRPPFSLSGARVRVEPLGPKLIVSGTVDDPSWGRWALNGTIDRAAKTGWVEIAGEDVPLDAELLRTLPFVPLAVWDHISPAGRGAARVRIDLKAERVVQYTAEIKPHAIRLDLPGLQAGLTDVTGTIRLRDNAVELVGLVGKAAGGRVTADGVFDLTSDPATAELRLKATNVDVRRLPSAWGVPQDFAGRLTGRADVHLTLHANGRVEPRGTGSGSITGTWLPGRATDLPLRLRGDGTRLHFDRGD